MIATLLLLADLTVTRRVLPPDPGATCAPNCVECVMICATDLPPGVTWIDVRKLVGEGEWLKGFKVESPGVMGACTRIGQRGPQYSTQMRVCYGDDEHRDCEVSWYKEPLTCFRLVAEPQGMFRCDDVYAREAGSR